MVHYLIEYNTMGNLLKTEKLNNFYNRKDINDGNGNSRGYEKKTTSTTGRKGMTRMGI